MSDLHGQTDRYEKLFTVMENERPDVVFLGGDILPGLSMLRSLNFGHQDFIRGFIVPRLDELKISLGDKYPRIFVILGNDDGRFVEQSVFDTAVAGYWQYIHNRRIRLGAFSIYGYNYVPPTPFQLKDWERYDVSRYVDPGCVSPEEGGHSFPVPEDKVRYSTIQEDLKKLVRDDDLSKAVFLFHAPPYNTKLDRAALDGKMIDYIPLDVHVGSIAMQRFITERQPLLTLHGHIHESTEITGHWSDQIGKTSMFNASHNGPELSLIRFRLDDLANATRELI
ncbi:metallophosphoesterase [bacterium]|nr:metallophosphoesterase [bacterium]MBU1652610.1 metallophosphoesterase [bacterium]MBU1882043.1 metallophosphoesterase [bacterium]